jgi:integrase/recombinase XerD
MSSLYKKRGVYYYHGKDREGNRIQRSLKTENRVKALEKKQTLDERFGHADVAAGPALSTCVDEYLKRRRRQVDRDDLSERTLSSDRRALELLQDWVEEPFGDLSVDDIEGSLIRGFKEGRLDDVSPTTVAKNLRHIQSFFSDLVKRGTLSSNPIDAVDVPKTRRRDIIPSQREFEALKTWVNQRIENEKHPEWILLLMKLCCHTGMRIGEVVSIKWERGPRDFGTGHSRNYVYLDCSEKTLTIKFKGKLRVIPVGHVWGVFERLKQRRCDGDDFVFTSSRSSEHFTTSTVCNRWKEEIEKCDALSRPYTSHSIRHAVVTHLLRNGVPVYKVGKVVGHSSEQITERYSHFIPDDLEDTMELLEE